MKTVRNFVITLVVVVLLLIIAASCMFTVQQGEYAIVQQFGKIVKIYDQPGLQFKMPIIQNVKTLSQKELFHDLPISDAITKDKQTLVADSFALWRISDPQKFIATLNGSMDNAVNRIEVSVYNALKNQISIRTQQEVISDRDGKLASDITEMAKPAFEQYGIELIAVETKHLDLPLDNKDSVYNRMISERNNIYAAYEAEGEKNSQMIRSQTDKEVSIMLGKANADAEKLKAEGEAEYMRILSEAYNDSSKAEFYEFVRSLDAAKISLKNGDNVIVLNEDSPLAKIFYANGMVSNSNP